MITPIIIDRNYGIINNAAGQISRTFWEHTDREVFDPYVFCGNESPNAKSQNLVFPISDNKYIRHFFGAFKQIGFPDWSLIPDRGRFAWNPNAYQKIVELSRSVKFDYIHSISSPQSTHLLALKLKSKLGIPWIAQFDDPWHDTSGRNYKLNYYRTIDLELEKKVAESADIIIHSNQVIRDIWVERYGDHVAKKIVILPFNFNIYSLPKVLEPKVKDDKLVISHIGHIYSTRSSLTMLKALESAIEKSPHIRSNIHINFIGGIHPNEKQYAVDKGLLDVVSFIPTLHPDELEKYYQDSNMFLIIDVNIKRSPNYPSKLMMYYYYQRPIIGITNPGSQLEIELVNTGNSCFYYGEYEKLSNMLIDATTNYEKYLGFDHNRWKRHTVENVQSLYYDLVTNKLLK